MRLFIRLIAAGVCVVALWVFCASSYAQTVNLDADYRNLWLNTTNLQDSPYSNYFGVWPDEALTNASTAVYGGSVFDNSNSQSPGLPVGGGYGLVHSAFGQPVESIVSDFNLGDFITAPSGADTNQPPANFVAVQAGNNTSAYYQSPDGGAFWVPSTAQIIAAQPNNISIDWIMLDGSTNQQVLNISAVPTKRPAKLFWTESPYDAPVVNLQGLFPVIHYNSEVSPPTFAVATNISGGITNYTTNLVSGVFLDDNKQLRATDVSGMFLVEYYQEGTYSQQVVPLGVEIVQVLAPDIQLLNADVGERLLPSDLYWADLQGIDGVVPNVTRGINETVYVYTIGGPSSNDGPKDNWAFSIKRTGMEPWAAEIYWQHTGVMDVLWPFEADWYFCEWPTHPQLLVLGDNGNQAPIIVPTSLTAQLMEDMEPALHAEISASGRTISSTEPGTCLIQYTTHDDIWYDVVRTVYNTNRAYFDLEPNEWVIGEELSPGDPEAHALQFDGVNSEVLIGTSFLNRLDEWTFSLWFSAQDFRGATLYAEGSPTNDAFRLMLTTNGQFQVTLHNKLVGGGPEVVTTANAPVESNTWHYLTLAYSDGSDTNGTLQLYLDDYSYTTNGLPRVNFDGGDQALVGVRNGQPGQSDWFQGKLDEVHVWQEALDSAQVSSNRYASVPTPQDSLIANFPFDEGDGVIVDNEAGDRSGTLVGNVVWSYGQTFPDDEWLGYPGYINLANGFPDNNRYNVDRYAYPTEATPDATNSYVFAVNTGNLEVWWANESRNTDMPPVYYASRVVRYTNQWPSDPLDIVIASGLGSSAPELQPLVLANPSIYYQNDSTLDGYNPNEEHALMLQGVAYGLRNDLNLADSSEPFVLVDHLDALTARPRMQLFSVLTTNETYNFERELTAGLPILPPEPLAAFPPAASTITDATLPAWRDRKLDWWAASAGNDGGTANATMRFWYQLQAGFYFPSLGASEQPDLGTEVPWLPNPSTDGGSQGTPVAVTYHISWPEELPKLHLGQTLTTPINGLPDVWDQLSVEIPYQQSHFTTTNDSVTLFDPVVDRGADLDSSVIDTMISASLARQDLTSPLVRFPDLPPSLYPRMFYDPDRGADGQLVIEGQLVETLTGGGYLLLNMLEPFERQQLVDAAEGIDSGPKGQWDAAVNSLPSSINPIQADVPYVQAALGARLSMGSGYVTLAFNNSTDPLQVPTSLPVSLSIIEVDTNLYSGELEVIEPADVLAEQLSLRISADFAGFAEECEYRWRWANPVGGLPPDIDFIGTNWFLYGPSDVVQGSNEVTIEGASPFTLADHYFAVQYRPVNTNGPSGEAWSEWTYNLAPGWVVRAMTGINPFAQVYADTINNAVDTRVTMISEAGGPYEGDVALNLEAASAAGLIPTYETIFHRAQEFSLLAGLSDPDVNETLLFAAGRLRDLYALLGNEAFADAQDPTVAYPFDLEGSAFGAVATSIFPFMNQVPTLLEEELALLRGRDDTLLPDVGTSPIYNRLIWNFTAGIDGGEPAYAYNYSILGNPSNTTGVITAEDAKRLYPQGHGDAWGHYLSALDHYYDLLAFTNFVWQTTPGATLLGNATVSTDFMDEQKFAETAASRARTGVQIVNLTMRQRYSENPEGQWPDYYDSNTNRAWGIAGWSSRSGQAAYYDWAVVNSLMWDSLTNLTQVGGADQPPEGIQLIDREHTLELHSIAYSIRDIQQVVDNADAGVNPLGLARNVVPFDIDPAGIDAGQTHFEQIYDRALQAVYNSIVTFAQAREVSLALNKQFESLHDLEETLAANETDYHNRLTEIYGYPYSDDIGPTGNYPQGYDGPDLLNWQILDLDHLLGVAPTGQVMQVQVYDLGFTTVRDGDEFTSLDFIDYAAITGIRSSNSIISVTNHVADNGLKVKPSTWTGSRRAQGELQIALGDFVQGWYALQSKIKDYEQTLHSLEVEIAHRQSDYQRYVNGYDDVDGEWNLKSTNEDHERQTQRLIGGLTITREIGTIANEWLREVAAAVAGVFPTIGEGLIGPFPEGKVTLDSGSPYLIASTILGYSRAVVNQVFDLAIESRELQQNYWDLDLEEAMTDYHYRDLLRWSTEGTLVDLDGQYIKQAEVFALVEALEQSQQRVTKLVAEGEKLIFDRGQIRSRAAERIQAGRYGDIGFRIFRDDVLRRYQSTFNLAARYTYLAAKAYDYETGLLTSDTSMTAGIRFMEDIVRARLPGRFFTWQGVPMLGGEGDPGLADILARMKTEWDTVEGRFGFNNPETETSRFSLRSELFRVSPLSSSDATWAQVLEARKVADIHQLPEFQRYCQPFSASADPEPGIVISFPSFVRAGENFFGHNLAGGDNAYDASHSATKIRSVGVWFTGFNSSFNTNSIGGGLANEPRIYLVPVGEDVMRSPTGDAAATRHWKVLDQAMPLPYDIGESDLDDPDWSPIADSLPEPLAKIRRYASLRAYHDSGQFDEAETHNNSRLIGRSVWNTQWMLIIPGRTLLSNPDEAVERFIHGAEVNGVRDGNGVKDIKLFFQTYSISGD